MTTTAPIHWVNIIHDRIPLAERGLPITNADGDGDLAATYGNLRSPGTSPALIDLLDGIEYRADGRHTVEGVTVDGWVVDLDEAAGMAYALRLAAKHGAAEMGAALVRWANGETTDADRVHVARLLADRY